MINIVKGASDLGMFLIGVVELSINRSELCPIRYYWICLCHNTDSIKAKLVKTTLFTY